MMAPSRLWLVLAFILGVVVTVGQAEQCTKDQFKCRDSGECINFEWVCDDFPDCTDDTDEFPLYDCSNKGNQPAVGGADVEEAVEVDEVAPPSSQDQDDDQQPAENIQTPPPREPWERCALKKCQLGKKLRLVDGRTYKYQYVTQTQTEVVGSSPSVTSLTMDASLALNVLTACEMELVVERVGVMSSKSDSGGQEQTVEDTAFTAALTKNPLRAAISLLQNSMVRLDLDHRTLETDVVGECEVNYQVQGNAGTRLLIQKTRNIPTCTSRSSTTSIIQGVPYAFVGGLHTIPLLNSSSSCVQEIGERLVLGASCLEKHRFTPFSSEHGGLVTTVTQNLTFSTQSFSRAVMGAIHGRTDLKYDHHNHIHVEGLTADHMDDAQVWRAQADTLLDHIADNMRNEGVANNAPRLFRELVQALRHLDFNQLWAITEERTWGPERAMFDDALPMVGTGASVGVMRDLMVQHQVNDIITNTWLASLSFIPRPDLDTITEAAPLLEAEGPIPADAFLGVGSLVHSYCQDHPGCKDLPPVHRVMVALQGFVASGCRENTSEDKIKVLMALKGIGNAGLAVTQDIPESLARRFPCDVSRKPLQTMFMDRAQDSELRIAAYLELMRCADFQIIKLVKHMLIYEEVNQVSECLFVYSVECLFVYLGVVRVDPSGNLKETGLPSRTEIQGLLSNHDIISKFTVGCRKFSRSIEWSEFCDRLNVGGGTDVNIIFSQNSYIPRSATFNFTADLFGHNLNLLEFGARVEGWDRYTDSIFRAPQDRETPPSIKNRKAVELISRAGKQGHYLDKEAELSIHMKTFGNEIYYRHLHGMDKIMEAVNTLDPAERIRLLNEGQAINLHKSWLAAESAYIIPTTAGMPLNLSLTASVALDLHAKSPKFINVSLCIVKSRYLADVGVEVLGSMLVDGHAAQSGAQLVATLHSSTVLDGRFEIGGSENIRLDMKMPRDKIDIVNITSTVVLIHGSSEAGAEGSREVMEGVISDRMELTGCSEHHDKLGSKLCWNVQYPNASRVSGSPFYPLTGPSQLQLALHKTDPTLTTYQLRYTWERRPDYRMFLVSVNTPGTATSREHSVRYNINFRSQNIFLDLHSPITNVSARGRYVWTDLDKRLDLSLSLDNQETATLSTGLTSYRKSGSDVFTPIFTATYLGQDIVKVSGVIDVRQRPEGRYYEVKMQVDYKVPVGNNRWIDSTGAIKGELKDSGHERGAKLNISYTPSAGASEEYIRIECREADLSSDSDMKFERTWLFYFSQFENINFKGLWLHKRHFGSVENDLQVNFGENYENLQHRVDLYQALTVYMGDLRTTLNSTVSVKHRHRNLDLKVGGDWFHDDHVLNTGFLVQYATDKQVESRLHMKNELSGFLDTQGFWFLKVPDGIHWEVRGQVKERRSKIYKFEGEAMSGTNWRVEVSGVYADLSSRLENVHNLLLDVKLPAYGLTRINSTFHANDRQMSLDTHVLTNSGRKYQARAAYRHGEDQLHAMGYMINLELHLPNQLYTVSTEINTGSVITITNDLHLDRYRDIHMSVTADILQQRQRGFKALLRWDDNRDPSQKMDVKVMYQTPSERETSFTMDGFLFFLGQEYRANWKTHKHLQYVERDMVWEHKNEGAMSWTDTSQVKQGITSNMTLMLRRGDTAQLYGLIDITTPFTHWMKNHLEVKYSRNSDHIESTLKARWHDGEFVDLQLSAQKQITDSHFMIESKLDVSSSFEGLVSASTGVKLEKKPNIIDTNFYIQWDTDRLEIALEGKDDSFHDELRYSVFGQILTTIQDYREMSTAVDLMLRSAALDLQATTKWEGHNYKLHFNGEMYSGQEYLRSALVVTSLQQEDIITASLLIMVQWPEEQEIRVEGQVATLPQHFKAGIQIDSTLEEIRQAVIVLGHSKDTVIKTEAKVLWNDKVDVGFVLLGQVTSLTDFLVSCTILTPFPGYKVITGELRNLFRLDPEVRVHSRIYGQLGERKYGLGARYEQGQVPRLRIALELYTPLPDLHTIFLDLCDNSTQVDVKYDLTMQYGPTKNLRLNVELQTRPGGAEGRAIAVLPLNSLDEHLNNAHLEASGSYFWDPEVKLDLTLSSKSSIPTKLVIKGNFPSVEDGKLQVMITTPVDGYETLDFIAEYQVPKDEKAGQLHGQLTTTSGKVFQLTVTGTTKHLQGSFSSPFEPFRDGTFMWSMTAVDVLKSHLEGKLGWEGGDIILDATLDGTLKTPWKDLEHTIIHLEGTPQQQGFRNQLVLEGAGRTYRGDLLWQYRDDTDWEVDVQVERESGGQGHYTVHLGLTNVERRPLKAALHLTTPHQGFQDVKFDLSVQREQLPYHLKVGWESAIGSGDFEMTFRSLSFGKINGDLTMSVAQEQGPDMTYTVELNLINNSAHDMIDVEGSVDFKSNHDYWDHLVLQGKVMQVTSDPGELTLHLVWPHLDPITFKALAEHQDNFRVIKPTITLDLTRSKYSFTGEMRKQGQQLNLTGILDWERGSSGPQQVVLHSRLVSTIETGSDVTTVTGNMLAHGFPAGDGTIHFTSTLMWENQPITLDFKQELTEDGYEGEYNLEWPQRHDATSPWGRTPVHASLKHHFLTAGHRGTLQITADFTNNRIVQIDYGFKFPVTGDVTVELGASYQPVALKVKVERVTVVLADGHIKQRTSFEFSNDLWPFGISSTKETNRKSDTELEVVTTLDLYDLDDISRRITIFFVHNSAQSGRQFQIKGKLLDREVILAAGYNLTPRNFKTNFLGFNKEHTLKGKLSHPYRTVKLDGYYKRSSKDLTSFIKFNWDSNNGGEEEEVIGRLEWVDAGTGEDHLHQAFVSLTHPLLEEEIKLAGEVRQNPYEILATDIKLQYSPDPQKDLKMNLAVTRAMTHDGAIMFTGTSALQHPASKLLETWRKLVDIHVEVEQDNLGRWTVATTSTPDQEQPLMTYLEVHPSHPVMTITFDNLLSNETTYDTSFPRYIAEQVVVDVGMEDHRKARFSIKHLSPPWLNENEDQLLSHWITDAYFFFRLNHSRLLSSRLIWRPELEEEIMNEIGEMLGASYDLRQSLEDWLKNSLVVAGEEALARTQPILNDLAQISKPLLEDFRNESQEFIEDLWLLYNNINSTAGELKIQQSIVFVFSSIIKTLEDIPAIQRMKTRLEGGALKGQLKDPSGPGLKEKIQTVLSTLAEMHDQFAKQLYRRVSQAVQGFMDRVGEWLRRKWRAVYENYKPHILRTFDDVETNAWIIAENLIDWLQWMGLEIKSSAAYRRIQEMVTYLEDIYRDFTEKSKRENLEKYYNMFVEKCKGGFRMLMSRVAPFVEDWVNELWKAWEKLMQFRPVKRLRAAILVAYNKVVWTVRYVDIRGQVIDAMAFLLEHGYTIVSQTGVEASQKKIIAKTKFRFSPEEGVMELLQKLPIDWHGFDHTPNWRDLPEYQNIQWVRQTFFSSSNTSILDSWYKHLNLNFRPRSWIPPFPAIGYMIGEQHFMTFDGRHVEFKGRCQHLLVADMVWAQWAVAVNYHIHSSRTIIIYVDGSEIELATDFRVTIDGQPTELPAGLPSAQVHRWLNKIYVKSQDFSVTWNLAHDVLSVSLYGYSFNKTGGLLGVYNNEPSDDLQLPDGSQTDVGAVLANAWDISHRQCQSRGNIARGQSKVPIEVCTRLFQSKSSPFKHCFFQIDPTPYLHMCLVDYRGRELDTCTAATAYMEACSNNNIPTKIPVFCVQCEYMTNDGETRTLEEGTSVVLEQEEILMSTDVVILVEARSCNTILAQKKPLNRFHTFITRMNEELEANDLRLVRYAMVVYGSDYGLFTMPTVVTVDNNIFTDAANIHKALNHVDFMNETYPEIGYLAPDAFYAFTFAAGLNFRAGVSVTFIHFPCDSCLPAHPSDTGSKRINVAVFLFRWITAPCTIFCSSTPSRYMCITRTCLTSPKRRRERRF
ncbi:Apolipophorins-like 6 [Homarus americanus]|uniref:Apolipophorins-like 6 n=1 Tax=Homarus americanus TaxID=6706 RepID=A0A8J5JHR2_HOMAM|nr:Apolipophorins-like 6 [Homarus americanus]